MEASPITMGRRAAVERALSREPEELSRIEFDDPVGTDHDFLGKGLRKALYSYMHGVGLEEDVRSWFEVPANVSHSGTRQRRRGAAASAARSATVPATTVPSDLIEQCLA